jgi:surface antigen
MKSTLKTFAVVSASALLLAACSGPQNANNARNGGITGGAGGFSKQDWGTGLGAIAGGVAGAQFGKGDGRLVTTALGALLGSAIGSSAGASLDRADLAYYDQTAQRALETGSSGRALPWNNPDSGNSGVVIPSAPYKNTSGQYCREFQNKITVGGKTQNGYGTACRQPDGSWQIVAD